MRLNSICESGRAIDQEADAGVSGALEPKDKELKTKTHFPVDYKDQKITFLPELSKKKEVDKLYFFVQSPNIVVIKELRFLHSKSHYQFSISPHLAQVT